MQNSRVNCAKNTDKFADDDIDLLASNNAFQESERTDQITYRMRKVSIHIKVDMTKAMSFEKRMFRGIKWNIVEHV